MLLMLLGKFSHIRLCKDKFIRFFFFGDFKNQVQRTFTIDTCIMVYFTFPGSLWEGGVDQNTNGLIRQYFPKGKYFTQVTDEEI